MATKGGEASKSWEESRRCEPSSSGKVNYMPLLEDALLFFSGFLLTTVVIPTVPISFWLWYLVPLHLMSVTLLYMFENFQSDDMGEEFYSWLNC